MGCDCMNWLRIGSCCRPLWTRWWIFSFDSYLERCVRGSNPSGARFIALVVHAWEANAACTGDDKCQVSLVHTPLQASSRSVVCKFTRVFLAMFITSRHCFCPEPHEHAYSQFIRSVWVLSSHLRQGLPISFFFSEFRDQIHTVQTLLLDLCSSCSVTHGRRKSEIHAKRLHWTAKEVDNLLRRVTLCTKLWRKRFLSLVV
jgi:hypothetical protein